MKTKTVIAALAIPAAAFTSTAFHQAPSIVKLHNPTNQRRTFATRLLSLLRSAILAAAALLAGAVFAQTPVGVPSKVLGAYFTAWSLSTAGEDRMNIRDVTQDANVIFLFNLRPDAGGAWTWPFWTTPPNGTTPGIPWPSRDDVQFVRARGQKVLLTLGGGEFPYDFDSDAKAQATLDAIRFQIDNNFGPLDGINLNTFEGYKSVTQPDGSVVQTPRSAFSDPAKITWLIQQLRAQYGSGFALVIPPGGGSPPQDADLQLATALNNSHALTFAAPQFYDWNAYKPAGAVSNSTFKWIQELGPTKTVMGLSANYDTEKPSFRATADTANYVQSLTLAESEREWDAVAARFPDIGGVTAWTAQYNHQAGNQWTTEMRARVLGSSPPPPPSLPPPTKIQAENGAWSGSGVAVNTTDIGGYEGTGFLAWFSNAGDQMSVSFPNVAGGTYDINIRYVTWSTQQQQNNLVVNGVPSSQMFPGTSSSWAVKTISGVTLAPGTNVIGITKDWGWIGVDSIEIVPAGSPVRIQAENGTWSGSGVAVNTTDIAGYEGTGFLAWFSNAGDQMSVSFPNVAGGTYNINIRYATWSTAQQQNNLIVNGTSSSQMFPGTSSSWVVKTISGVTLAPGTNVISISKDWGFIGVDYIEITK